MNNAIYGKAMENLRNGINVKLVNNEKDYLKRLSKPSHISHQKFNNNLVLIRRTKLALKFNKPTYIGMCVLELSKIGMYEFHYDYIKNKSGNNSELLFTDTDSLMYKIKTEDVCKDFSSDKEMFDLSNYSANSKYYDDSNKLVIDKKKDETADVSVEESIGLKPKIYSFFVDITTVNIKREKV